MRRDVDRIGHKYTASHHDPQRLYSVPVDRRPGWALGGGVGHVRLPGALAGKG